MENFDGARKFLEQAGGRDASNRWQELYQQTSSLMANPERKDRIGAAVKDTVLQTSKAAARRAEGFCYFMP